MQLQLFSRLLISVSVAMLCATSLATGENRPQNLKSEEYAIGVMVKSIQAALFEPEKSKSFTVIVAYGHDSRYYVMIRGWVTQELQSTESQLSCITNEETKRKLMIRDEFLKRVIRNIDLE